MSQLDLYLAQWEENHDTSDSEVSKSFNKSTAQPPTQHQLIVNIASVLLFLINGFVLDVGLYLYGGLVFLSSCTSCTGPSFSAILPPVSVLHGLRLVILYYVRIYCVGFLRIHSNLFLHWLGAILDPLVLIPAILGIFLAVLYWKTSKLQQTLAVLTKIKIDQIKRVQHLTLGKGLTYPLPTFFGDEDAISSKELPKSLSEEKNQLLQELMILSNIFNGNKDREGVNNKHIKHVVTIQQLTAAHKIAFSNSMEQVFSRFNCQAIEEKDWQQIITLLVNIFQTSVRIASLYSHLSMLYSKVQHIRVEDRLRHSNQATDRSLVNVLNQTRRLRAMYEITSYKLYCFEQHLCGAISVEDSQHKAQFMEKMSTVLVEPDWESPAQCNDLLPKDDWINLFDRIYELEVNLGLKKKAEDRVRKLPQESIVPNDCETSPQSYQPIPTNKNLYDDGEEDDNHTANENGLDWTKDYDELPVDVFVATTDPILIKNDRITKENKGDWESRNQSKKLLVELQKHSDIQKRTNRTAIVKEIDDQNAQSAPSLDNMQQAFSAVPISANRLEPSYLPDNLPKPSLILTQSITSELAKRLQANKLSSANQEIFISDDEG